MKRILCYGDSNTYGYDPRDYFGMPYKNPWPALTSEQSGHLLINCGENGRCIPASAYALTWLKEDFDLYKPIDLCIIMLGTNDLLSSMRPDVAVITDHMKGLISYIQSVCAVKDICIVAPPYMNHDLKCMNTYIDALAHQYQQLAKAMNVDYLDTRSWDLKIAFDGVHLTEHDHIEFANQISHFLTSTYHSNMKGDSYENI